MVKIESYLIKESEKLPEQLLNIDSLNLYVVY